MQCRYCGAENSNAAKICAFCKQPIPMCGERHPVRGANYLRIKREDCFYPTATQFGIKTRVQTLRRTRRLTGSTLPKSKPSPSAAPKACDARNSPRTEKQQAPHASQDPPIFRPSMQDRTEPSWSEPTTPLPNDPAFRQSSFSPAAEMDAAGGKTLKARRILFMLCIFIVGAGAGLAGAWWFGQTGSLPFVVADESPSATPLTSLTPVKRLPGSPPTGTTGATRGISASELPYDGAIHPEAIADGPKQSQRLATGDTGPLAPPSLKTAKPPVSDVSATQNVSPPVRRETGVAVTDSESSGERHPGAEASQDKARESRRDVAEKNDSKKPVAKVSAGSDASESAKISSTPKRTSSSTPANSTKDREIDRIRQQAEEELKKSLNMAGR